MTSWDNFFQDKIKKIFTEKKSVIDIGGGLRISREKGNRFNNAHSWILPLAKKVDYKILDPVPDYKPDVLGDIHHLPFADNSQDAIICIAVLEHVENPIQAASELYRVLKPGGYLFVYLPFLYYYHAQKGYYQDYWRFTSDSIDVLFKNFSQKEICPVRGAMATWFKNSPLGKSKTLMIMANFLDKVMGKDKSKQVSGWNVFLIK